MNNYGIIFDMPYSIYRLLIINSFKEFSLDLYSLFTTIWNTLSNVTLNRVTLVVADST